MPRDHGRVQAAIWRDKDFQQRTPDAQRLYMLLLSQPNVNNAGVLPLQITKWAKGCVHTTTDDVRRALDELADHRFVFYDEDTEEAMIRSYIRNDGVLKHPNIVKNALRCAEAVESPSLRVALADELRRTRRRDAAAVADGLNPNPIPIPFETHSDGIQEGLESYPDAESHSDAVSILAGRGKGEGEGSSSPLVELREGARAKSNRDEHAVPAPSPNCPKHPNGTTVACRPCGQAREARQKWDADRVRRDGLARSAEARSRAEVRAQAIRACDMCDDAGYVNGTLCDHDPSTAERAKRGLAAARAALNGNGDPNA